MHQYTEIDNYEYRVAESERRYLKSYLSPKESFDLYVVINALMDSDEKFLPYKDPERREHFKNEIFEYLTVPYNYLTKKQSVNASTKRLGKDYGMFKFILKVFNHCAINGESENILLRYIFPKDFDKLIQVV